MRARSDPILAVVTLALSACGGGSNSNAGNPKGTASASGYTTGADVAMAAQCTHYAPKKNVNGTTTGRCAYHGHTQTVMWFPTTPGSRRLAEPRAEAPQPTCAVRRPMDGAVLVRCQLPGHQGSNRRRVAVGLLPRPHRPKSWGSRARCRSRRPPDFRAPWAALAEVTVVGRSSGALRHRWRRAGVHPSGSRHGRPSGRPPGPGSQRPGAG